MTDRTLDLLATFVAISAVVLVIVLFKAYDNGKDACAEAGGELKRYGRTTLCVSSDGRILDTSR